MVFNRSDRHIDDRWLQSPIGVDDVHEFCRVGAGKEDLWWKQSIKVVEWHPRRLSCSSGMASTRGPSTNRGPAGSRPGEQRGVPLEMFKTQCYIYGNFICFVNDFEQPTSLPVTLAIFCPVTSSMVRPILPTCKFCFKCSMFQHQVYWVYYLFTLSQGYN